MTTMINDGNDVNQSQKMLATMGTTQNEAKNAALEEEIEWKYGE